MYTCICMEVCVIVRHPKMRKTTNKKRILDNMEMVIVHCLI